MLYIRQLNCSVVFFFFHLFMFIWAFGLRTLVLVQMKYMFSILLDCMEWSLVFLWLADAALLL